MKTLLLAILLLPLSLFAQSNNGSKANIINISSDTVYTGDSAWVEINYTVVYGALVDTMRLSITGKGIIIFRMPFKDLDKLPKPNGLTRIYCKIPEQCDLGSSYFGGGYSAPKKVFIKKRIVTSIDEQIKDQLIKSVTFYNLMGQVVSEYEPYIIKATLFMDGSFKIDKQSSLRP